MASAKRGGVRLDGAASVIIDDIQTDASRERRVKEKEEKEEALMEARISPAEEESEMIKPFTNEKVGVSGLFSEATRTDQEVLDVLNSQGDAWSSIVALTSDVAGAKKRLMSRSARYSGLLNKLVFAEWAASSSAEALASALDKEGIEAWLAFGVTGAEAETCLKAASLSESCKRVVLAVDGGSGLTKDAVASKFDESKLESWTLVNVPGGVTDDAADYATTGEVSVDFVAEAEAAPVTRDDVARVVAEAFVLKSADKASFSLAYGGENATGYLKSLREAGFTRRGEISKMLSGDLPAWLERVSAAEVELEEKAKKGSYKDDPVNVIVQDGNDDSEFQAQLAAVRAEAKAQRDEKVGKAARLQLKAEYGEKQFTTCRAVTEEEYIRYYWNRAVDEQAQFLGYKKTNDFYDSGGPRVEFPDETYGDDAEDEE